jgi:hypothetical protein
MTLQQYELARAKQVEAAKIARDNIDAAKLCDGYVFYDRNRIKELATGTPYKCYLKGHLISGVVVNPERSFSSYIVFDCLNLNSGSTPSDMMGYSKGWAVDGDVKYFQIPKDMKIMTVEELIYQQNKNIVDKLIPDKNEYFPLSYDEIIPGSYVITISSDIYPIRKDEKGVYSVYKNNHREYFSKVFRLMLYRDAGWRFYTDISHLYASSIKDAKKGQMLFDITSKQFKTITAISKDRDGKRIFNFGLDVRISEDFVSLVELSEDEISKLIQNKIESDPRFNYLNSVQPFGLELKDFLNTNLSFIQLLTNNKNGSRVYSTNAKVDGYHLTLTNNYNVKVYIPVEYLNYFGYTEEFLLNYIDKLNTIFSDKVYQYKGIDKFEDFETCSINNILSYNTFQHRLINNAFYVVEITRTKFEFEMLLKFMMLNYITHHFYKNIPHIFMDILDKVGSKIDIWKAFLLANSSSHYKHEWSLLLTDNRNNVVDLEENDLPFLLDTIYQQQNINHSFEYAIKNTDEVKKYQSLILEGKYIEALRFINFDILN